MKEGIMDPMSLRHSLATNMMSENVPISAIANILGHSSTRTTEIYLTVDETHLKEISLGGAPLSKPMKKAK